jgi:hypothetical protein
MTELERDEKIENIEAILKWLTVELSDDARNELRRELRDIKEKYYYLRVGDDI